MSNKYTQNDSPAGPLKNGSTRQRWEMFHRAIAHAKQSNDSAMQDADGVDDAPAKAGPLLTIVR